MATSFYKYHGAGNDFIMIDNRDLSFNKSSIYIHHLCDRYFGIGSDGLILLENDEKTDFKMVYYNADGNESTMCGNGGRCIVAFAKKLNIIINKASFIAIDGLHNAEIDDENNVNLQMKGVSLIEKHLSDFVLDTGSPHYVKIVDTFSDDFVEDARKIRNSAQFKKEGINVNFIKVEGKNITIRTFERGVENETLACGTGCVAAALTVMKNNPKISRVRLKAKGGILEVVANNVDNSFQNIWLFGPTQLVFSGKLNN